MKKSILLIEDEKLMRVTLEDVLRTTGYDVMSFEKGTEALNALRDNLFDVVVTDVRLPDINGMDILRQIGGSNDIQVIVMTAFGTIKDAVEAMKDGAFDYITKPFSIDEFLLVIERALDVKELKEENLRLKNDLAKYYCFPNIIGQSAAIKKVCNLIEKVSKTDSTVLLFGESGTGKELIATTIHYQSRRRDKPLIKVNCAAIPDGLVESELFGHEKGAFTGAVKARVGRFELANQGTIFLDEVGDIPLSTQSKILRVLQERQFERLGGSKTINVDVRIIAATNRNLEEEVKKGSFREDLYYRLNVIPITLPPLRERKEDIPFLIDFFLKKYKSIFSRDVHFSKDAIDALTKYDYPGNIRELENITERCVTLSSSSTIQKDDLPPFIFKIKDDRGQLSLADVAAEAEREYIIRILKTTKGNKTKAAEMLGISRKTLWEKMNLYEIER